MKARKIDGTLDPFTRGYVTCALWLTDESPGSGEWAEHGAFTIRNIHMGTLRAMIRDCRAFQADHAADLLESGLTDGRAGQDFWLNRNGYGSGFWDEGDAPCFERLSDASHGYGEYDLYLGDNGRLFGFSG